MNSNEINLLTDFLTNLNLVVIALLLIISYNKEKKIIEILSENLLNVRIAVEKLSDDIKNLIKTGKKS